MVTASRINTFLLLLTVGLLAYGMFPSPAERKGSITAAKMQISISNMQVNGHWIPLYREGGLNHRYDEMIEAVAAFCAESAAQSSFIILEVMLPKTSSQEGGEEIERFLRDITDLLSEHPSQLNVVTPYSDMVADRTQRRYFNVQIR